MFGDGVDQTTGGDVCTTVSGNTCQNGAEGSGPGELSTPEVRHRSWLLWAIGRGRLRRRHWEQQGTKFAPDGTLVAVGERAVSSSGFGGLAGIATDPSGKLFVFEVNGTVQEFGENASVDLNLRVPSRYLCQTDSRLIPKTIFTRSSARRLSRSSLIPAKKSAKLTLKKTPPVSRSILPQMISTLTRTANLLITSRDLRPTELYSDDLFWKQISEWRRGSSD